MKRIFLPVAAVVLTATGAFAQSTQFTLKGDVTKVGAPVEWVFLTYVANGQRVNDSAKVDQGKYSFTGNIPEPMQASIRARYKEAPGARGMINRKRDVAILFLEPAAITIASVDSFANVTITGSKADIEFRKLQAMEKPYSEKLDKLYVQYTEARKNKDEAAMKSLEKTIDSIDSDTNDRIYANYVKKNPNSPLALFALQNWAGYDIDPVKVEPVFNSLPAATRNLPSGKSMAEKIAVAKKTGVGQLAMDFTQNDTSGAPVTLSSLRGKYLLVDFWASWCGPCRAENPNVVKAYEQYKDKGFSILSVSLDQPNAKEKWLKAIHDDGLRWTHVSDLQFWNNAVAKLYGIQAIPQNLLLDPQGKIIAKNLRGDALTKKLSEVLTN